MAVTQKVTLYNNKFTVPPVINAVQNDTDRQVEAYFGDFTLQVGMTGVLSFIRSDRTHYEVSATLDTATNTATAELDQALTQAGVTQAQLKITDSGNVGSTFTFMIKVQPDVAGISVPQDGWSAQEFDQRLIDAENAIDAVEEDVADLQEKEYDYAPVITDTASGAIATFPDGADSYPLKECLVDVDAVQDLHGYDHPWPAGGNKNKYKMRTTAGSSGGVTITPNSDGTVNISGSTSGSGVGLSMHGNPEELAALFAAGGTFAFSMNKGTYDANKFNISVAYKETANGDQKFITPGSSKTIPAGSIFTTSNLWVAANQTVPTLNGFALQLEASASPTSFVPYSNICPITGFSTAKVTRTGINVWDEETKNGYYSNRNGEYTYNAGQLCSKNFIAVKPNTEYRFCKSFNLGDLIYYGIDKTYLSAEVNRSANAKFTTPDNCYFIQINLSSIYGGTYNHDVSINYPSTGTTYHPYVGQTVTIDLDGTRYGCTLDVRRGKLRVDMAMVDMGTLNWSYYSDATTSFFSAQGPSGIKPVPSNTDRANMICSQYSVRALWNDGFSTSDNVIAQASPSNLRVRDSAYTDATAFKTAMNGVQLVYELATPIEVDLTPTEITTLLGTNNIFSDTGDVSIEYCCDTRRFIEKKLAELV